jgi:hypothetical protein
MRLGHMCYTEIHVKGKPRRVASACIDGHTVIATGHWIKTAVVWDADLLEEEPVPVPEVYVPRLKASGLKADLLTFVQKLPDVTPKHTYHLEWDRVAAMPITTFAEWWEKLTRRDVRRSVTKAKRLGVVVKLVEFDDIFVQEIVDIYNESPTRQGKLFWHYQKDFATVKRETATYMERSTFLGAYYNDELIGFMKIVHVGTIAIILQIIGKKKHFNKRPMNALIAKAVEICALQGMSHLTYGEYDGSRSSLGEFKRHNGFQQILLPRYYIPLTLKGQITLKLKLHHRFVRMLPQPVFVQLRKVRNLWYTKQFCRIFSSKAMWGMIYICALQ